MRKRLLPLLLLGCALGVAAQSAAPAEAAPQYQDLNYAGDTIEAHRLDLYLPTTSNGRPPKVIVAIYGSAWYANNMKRETFRTIGRPLLDAGFAVACINHRSSSDARFPAQLHDVKAAVRFLRAHADRYGLDASFVGITGSSSGGHLAALTGTTNGLKTTTGKRTGEVIDMEGTVGPWIAFSSRVDAVVDWFGPADMARMHNCETYKDETSPEAALIGGAPATMPDMVEALSPISHVSEKSPRFLIIHGTADTVVPYCQSFYLAERLKTVGRLSDFIAVPDGRHGPVTFNETTFQQMADFFLKEAAESTATESENQ